MTFARSPRSLGLRRIASFVLREPAVVIAVLVILLALVCTIAPSLIAPMDPGAQRLGSRLLPPGSLDDAGRRYWFGTDWLGRDILSRIVFGTRITVLLAITSVVVRTVLGTILGTIGGYFGGAVDAVIMRLVDVQLALPFLLLGLAFVSISGPSVANVVIVLGISGWIVSARIIRAQVLSLRNGEFVEGAKAVGASHLRIIARHVLPNVSGLVLVVATVDIPTVILSESALSFLGVGVPMSMPSWGAMIAQGRAHLTTSWWVPVIPGAAVALMAAAVATLGDWLQSRADRGLSRRW